MQVKRDLAHVVERNQEKSNVAEAYESVYAAGKRYVLQYAFLYLLHISLLFD